MNNEEALVSGSASPAVTEIDFEAWVDLSARLLKLDQEARFAVLEEREIDPVDFTRAEQRWVLALSDDLSAERMDRVDFYAARCAAEMQRRKEMKPESVLVAVDAPAPVKAPARIDVPTLPADVPAREGAAPFVVFSGVEASTRPAPSVFLAPPALMNPPPAVAIQAPLPPVPAAVVSMPPVVRAPSHLSGTMPVSEPLSGARAAAAALPFGHVPSAEFVSKMSAPKVSVPEAVSIGETLPLGVDFLGEMRKGLPFMKAVSSAPVRAAAPATVCPQLTLDTYASLCAELSVFPEQASEILKKYGITDDAGRRAVDREWSDRLSAHPVTQDLWQRKVSEFRAWLLRGGR